MNTHNTSSSSESQPKKATKVIGTLSLGAPSPVEACSESLSDTHSGTGRRSSTQSLRSLGISDAVDTNNSAMDTGVNHNALTTEHEDIMDFTITTNNDTDSGDEEMDPQDTTSSGNVKTHHVAPKRRMIIFLLT